MTAVDRDAVLAAAETYLVKQGNPGADLLVAIRALPPAEPLHPDLRALADRINAEMDGCPVCTDDEACPACLALARVLGWSVASMREPDAVTAAALALAEAVDDWYAHSDARPGGAAPRSERAAWSEREFTLAGAHVQALAAYRAAKEAADVG